MIWSSRTFWRINILTELLHSSWEGYRFLLPRPFGASWSILEDLEPPRCLPDASQMFPRCLPDPCFQENICLGSRAGVILLMSNFAQVSSSDMAFYGINRVCMFDSPPRFICRASNGFAKGPWCGHKVVWWEDTNILYYCLRASCMLYQNLNHQGNVSKIYLPTSWLMPGLHIEAFF